METSQANLNANSLDLDESLDISETRERKTKWPIVEVAVSLFKNFAYHSMFHLLNWGRDLGWDSRFYVFRSNEGSYSEGRSNFQNFP